MANPASHSVGGVDYPLILFANTTRGSCPIRRVRSFLGVYSWPEGFRCPSCCGNVRLANRQSGSVAIATGVSVKHRSDGGQDRRVHTESHGDFGSRICPILADHEARGQSARPETHSWPGQLSDRLGLAAQVAVLPCCKARGVIYWSSSVEVPETYVGGRDTEQSWGYRFRSANWIVAIAAEVRCRGTYRIRMSRNEDVATRSLIPFIQTTVRVYRDRAEPMADQPTVVWRTKAMTSSRDPFAPDMFYPAHIVIPRVHRVAALLDRWWLGIHHSAIAPDQCRLSISTSSLSDSIAAVRRLVRMAFLPTAPAGVAARAGTVQGA